MPGGCEKGRRSTNAEILHTRGWDDILADLGPGVVDDGTGGGGHAGDGVAQRRVGGLAGGTADIAAAGGR